MTILPDLRVIPGDLPPKVAELVLAYARPATIEDLTEALKVEGYAVFRPGDLLNRPAVDDPDDDEGGTRADT